MIQDDILALQDPQKAVEMSRFFKTGPGQYGENDVFLGLTNPQIQVLVKKYGKEVSFDTIEDLLKSEYHEFRAAALGLLKMQFSKSKNTDFKRQCVDFYTSHTQTINNWDLVDTSCPDILGVWFLDKTDRSLLYTYARSGSLWLERISIVSCLTFVRHGQFTDAQKIADILQHHSHDLIHKAVGWTLREMGKKDTAVLITYLSPRYRSMPRTMLRYAIEKFPEEQRKSYLLGIAP